MARLNMILLQNAQLFAYIRDMYAAGTKGHTEALHWIVLTSLFYPEQTKKLVEEIDRVLGKQR